MIFITFLVISTILLVIGIGIIYYKVNLKNKGIKAEGIVIRNERYIESTFDSFNQLIPITVYRAVIEFTIDEGVTVKAICDDGSIPPKYKVGDTVKIIYPKNSPEDVVLVEQISSMELPLVFISLSIMMYIFSFIILII